MSGLGAAAVRAVSGVACALPERPLVALAEAVGELWYRTTPARAERARRNIGRVAEACARDDRGSVLARRAATDPKALELLVRRAYRHAARYYLEVARTPTLDPQDVVRRLTLETPEAVEQALTGGPVIVVGAHFGAIEVPVIYLAARTGHPFAAPMETVADPGLQAWIERSRSRAGITVVPLERARRVLTAELRAGRSVGLIADRDLTGGGVLVPFFGAPARLPVGPALLALETGAPLFVGGARRAPGGRYIGRLELLRAPEAGTRRERTMTLVNGTAAIFERLIADAPEQWWGCFHAIWPDLEAEDARADAAHALPAGTATPDSATGERETAAVA